MKSNDQILWDQLRTGNKNALESIYRSEVDYLYNYSLRLTKDGNLISDAIQDLFIELWNKRSSLGTTDTIRPYLITSIRRKIISLIKKGQKTVGDVESELAFRTDASIDEHLIAQESSAENKAKLNKSLERLSERQREAIYLKYFNDHSYEEICEIMGLNYQSARNLISSGLKKMKDAIKKNTFLLILVSTIYQMLSYMNIPFILK